MRTLVYVGCNRGDTLSFLLGYNFDKILCVDADPTAINLLKQKFVDQKNIIAINTCLVPNKEIKEIEFCFNKNSATNSILQSNCLELDRKEKIQTSYLPDILEQHKIHHISFYVSDLQGKDLEVLVSLKQYIKEKKIDEIFIETYNDLNRFYENSNNNIREFKKILEPEYKINYMSADTKILTKEESHRFLNNLEYSEVDVHWNLSTEQNYLYRAL